MAGVPVNGREPADEWRAIELERAQDVARTLERLGARLEALSPPKRPADVIAELLACAQRSQARKVFEALDAWANWGRRLEAELGAAVQAGDVLAVLERLAGEAFRLREQSAL